MARCGQAGEYAGGNGVLIQGVLKGAWGYPGWVMSDWGGTPGWETALKGLDQESGLQLDMMMWQQEWFTAPLRQAYADGKVPKERLSDMVRRILRSMFAIGVDRWGSAPEVDMVKHNEIALETARQHLRHAQPRGRQDRSRPSANSRYTDPR